MIKGLYFHIPFCHYKCPYCDFVSFTNPFPHKVYMEALVKELKLYRDFEFKVETIYFGGGTPSIVEPEVYAYLLRELSKELDLSFVKEVTIECNPEDYREEEFRELVDLGFSRVSIGVQSFLQKGLSILGRKHSAEDAIKCVKSAHKAGFENINVDIIYGYPNQSLEDLKMELKILEDLPVKHVSFYLLTPYEDTLFGYLHQKNLLQLPDEEKVEEMFLLIHEGMESLGFEHYEVSNFALEGYQCKHNLIYWMQEEFLGLGVSAWSFYKNVRFGNTKNLSLYLERLEKGQKPVAYEERLQGKELIKDFIFLGLRTSQGVPKLEQVPWEKVLKEMGEFFVEKKERIALNVKGMLLINEILLRIFKLIEHPHVV